MSKVHVEKMLFLGLFNSHSFHSARAIGDLGVALGIVIFHQNQINFQTSVSIQCHLQANTASYGS
jgi:hypothetical protein